MPSVPIRFVHPLLRARDYQEREEAARLAAWWRERGADGGAGVCCLVGIGGAGKTAIVERFLRLLPGMLPADPALPKDLSLQQPDRLFVFSFYDAPNPDSFFSELGVWLQDKRTAQERSASYSEVRNRLETAGSVLLVLDGVEKVQDDGMRGGVFGQLQDGRLRDLVSRVAEGYLVSTRIVLTSRFRMIDLLARRPPFFQEIPIEKLKIETAVALLRARGVLRGSENELARIAEEHGRHALTVDLLGGYIGSFCAGDPRKLPQEGTLAIPHSTDLDPAVRALREQERRLARVSERYRETLKKKDPAALALLERVCLFRLGVPAETLALVFTGEEKQEIAGRHLAALDSRELQRRLSWLSELRLLEASAPNGGETLYTVHPAIRESVLLKLDPAIVQRAHRAARGGLEAQLGIRPSGTSPSDAPTLDMLEEIVHHTLEAGLPQEAWHIYQQQIRGYANLGQRLGAYERGDRICRAFNAYTQPGVTPPAGLSSNEEGSFLNDCALYLDHLGRLDAASQYYKDCIELHIQQEKWGAAAVGKINLADSTLIAGQLVEGMRYASEALQLSRRANDSTAESAAHAYLAHAQALIGDITSAEESFNAALAYRRTARESDTVIPFFQASFLAKLGKTATAKDLCEASKSRFVVLDGPQSSGVPLCNLLLADLNRQRGEVAMALILEEESREWALARDAKEPLCWSTIVRAQIALHQGEFLEALAHSAEGLRIARDFGYGIFHIELLLTAAAAYLLAGNAGAAERAARTALFGAEERDDWAPPEERAHVPPPETGLPTLLATTHPECLYAWGEGAGRHLLAEALLLRAAAATPPDCELVEEASRQLDAALALRLRIQDPAAQETAERLAQIDAGVLTLYPIQPATPPSEEPTTAMTKQIRDQVFISYSHQDKDWLARLQVLLKPLVRNGSLALWADTAIQPGARWRQEIETALARAKVAVLLVSPDFLASDFIAEKELPPLLAAAEKDGVRILWVHLSPCLYDVTPIADYQAAHDIAKPLAELSKAKRNQALLDVAKAIQKAATA